MHAHKQLFRNFRSKIWTRLSLPGPRFPKRQIHFHYRVTFTGYIRCFCGTASHGLVTLTFDLLTLRVFLCTVLLMSDPRTNFYYPTTIGYWVTSTEYLITFPLSETSPRMRRVTCPLTGGKNSLHSWNPWPQFAYSLCHVQGATTKIKPCYGQKIAFSHYEGYKVYCACAVSRYLCIGGHPKPHVKIFRPRIAYSLYNFYGATMTIKGSLYLSIPMLKRFSVAKKGPVKIGPRNGGFS